MARSPRLDPEHGWHHVMNRGVNRETVFFCDSDRVEFGQRCADMYDTFGIETHAYCLLDNHFHLLLHCPDAGLSDGMQRLASIYTRHVNDRIGRDGPLFRGRFRSRPIDTDQYLLTACRYIHRNALDVAGVDDITTYRWSSHRTYLGCRPTPRWMRTDHVLAQFQSLAQYEAFMQSDIDRSPEPAAVAATSSDAMRSLVAAAQMVLAEIDGSGGDEQSTALARTIAIGAVADRPDVDNAVLAGAFSIPSSGAVRTARSRARTAIAANPTLREAVRRTLLLAG